MRVYLSRISRPHYGGALVNYQETVCIKMRIVKKTTSGIDYNFHDSARHAKFQTHHNLYAWRKHNISQLLDVGDGRLIVKIHYRIQLEFTNETDLITSDICI